jgi:hypothetical protein
MESAAIDKVQELAEKVKNVAVKEKNTAPKGEKKAKKAKGSEVPANGPLEVKLLSLRHLICVAETDICGLAEPRTGLYHTQGPAVRPFEGGI